MINKKAIILIFLFSRCLITQSQVKNKIFENLKVENIESINWKLSNNKMFDICNKIFDNHDLLILSESYHGDGSSYDAQCMILKALIDSSKINSIYTESSWINIEKINAILKQGGKDSVKSTIKYMRSVELRYWVDNGFWDYLANKIIENKIKLYGFDITGNSEYIVVELFNQSLLLSGVKKFISDKPLIFKDAALAFEHFEGWGGQSTCNEYYYNRLNDFLKIVIKCYEEKNEVYKLKQWKTISNFFYWLYKRTLILSKNKISNVILNEKQNSLFHSIRDSLIGEIFFDYYTKNEKAVALMSCYHSIRNSNNIEKVSECCKDFDVHVLGEKINEFLGSKSYNICFISGSGFSAINYFGNAKGHKITKPLKGSLEHWLNKQPGSYYFVDLENSSIRNESFYMKPVYGKYLKSNWAKNFSGAFFIKEMQPLNFKNQF
jgi:hypothetical protein